MHIVVVLLLSLLASLTAPAQPRMQPTLHGSVVDSASRQALPQATVSLWSVADSARVGLQLANAQGRFAFTSIPKGPYLLTVSYVDHQVETMRFATKL